MKKSIAVLIVVAMVAMLSSCSFYSCPTYAKGGKSQPVKKQNQQRI
jgi:flagellar basal body-associated protein FliL